jgi:twitching motility protein PilT
MTIAGSIGERLVGTGVITAEQRAWAESEANAQSAGVATVLLGAGLVTQAQVVAVAAERLGLPFFDLDADPPSHSLARHLAADAARRTGAVAVSLDGDTLTLAVADATDPALAERLSIELARPVRVGAAVPAAVARAIGRLYAAVPGGPLDQLLAEVVRAGGSDLHLTVGRAPSLRLHGQIFPIEGQRPLDDATVRELIVGALGPDRTAQLDEDFEVDCSYSVEGLGRFRLNAFVQRGSPGAVLRVIPTDIPELAGLGLPPAVASLASLNRGLVLVTGPTGSGKSTTLASLVDIVNRSRRAHIMTVEDPIEFVHPHKQSLVNQREVGQDTKSFAAALKHVLRQDPDVILVGELRDLETISTALTAAETGHLVLATLHTQSAAQSIDRIIDVFPAHQQQQIRTQLAGTLRAVVTQQLVPTVRAGRVVAAEVLIVTNAVKTLIRDGKTHQILSAMQSGSRQGMQTMDSCLAGLVRDGRITLEAAVEHCLEEDDLRRLAAVR